MEEKTHPDPTIEAAKRIADKNIEFLKKQLEKGEITEEEYKEGIRTSRMILVGSAFAYSD